MSQVGVGLNVPSSGACVEGHDSDICCVTRRAQDKNQTCVTQIGPVTLGALFVDTVFGVITNSIPG